MFGWIAIAVLLGTGVYRVACRYPRPVRRYRSLMRGEAAFIGAVAEAMFPAGGAIARRLVTSARRVSVLRINPKCQLAADARSYAASFHT